MMLQDGVAIPDFITAMDFLHNMFHHMWQRGKICHAQQEAKWANLLVLDPLANTGGRKRSCDNCNSTEYIVLPWRIRGIFTCICAIEQQS
jgi:hypothetical protein